MSSAFRISPRTPHTTAVFPKRTTALPLACVRELVLMFGVRNSVEERWFGRREGFLDDVGLRCARRYNEGESAAKV